MTKLITKPKFKVSKKALSDIVEVTPGRLTTLHEVSKLLRKKGTNAVHKKKYSFTDKVITKRINTFENLGNLLKQGKSKIYLTHIKNSYVKAYLSRPCNDIKSCMERLGYTALSGKKGRIFYDLIDYTNPDFGSAVNEKT